MAAPVEVDVTKIIYTDANGNVIPNGNSGGTSGSGTGSGIWGSIFGAIPGILSTLFPSGIGGGGGNTYPNVSTLPNGNQQVNLAGGNNTILIVAVLMVGFYFITNKQPVKVKK